MGSSGRRRQLLSSGVLSNCTECRSQNEYPKRFLQISPPASFIGTKLLSIVPPAKGFVADNNSD
jgi:hypothetical protein